MKCAGAGATRQHIYDKGESVGLDSFDKVFDKCSTQGVAELAAGIFPFNPQRALTSKNMAGCTEMKACASLEVCLFLFLPLLILLLFPSLEVGMLLDRHVC